MRQDWLNEALELHEDGLQVIPILSGSKFPAIRWKRWQTERQTENDLVEIAEYFQGSEPPSWLRDEGQYHAGRHWLVEKRKMREQWSQPVVLDYGVITGRISNLVVVDCDNDEARQEAVRLGLGQSPRSVKTPKGWHFWHQHPGGDIKNAVAQGVMGLDLRGDGGYVRVPPTLGLKWLSKGDMDELPVFPAREKVEPGGLDLGEIRLTSQSAEEWLIEKAGGRLITKGRRNKTMAIVIGMLIDDLGDRKAVEAKALELGARYFDDEKYAGHETLRILESIWGIDQKNHPEKHEVLPLPAIGYISDANAQEFIEALPPRKPAYVETILEPGKATMVAGYAGSGKSELLMMLLKAACDPSKVGEFVGPWQIQATPKALVLDPENNPHLIMDRLKRFGRIGSSGDNLRVIPGSVPGEDGMVETALRLNDRQHLNRLQGLLAEHQPDIVVFDTVRSHYPGLKENDAAEWTDYNVLTQKLCRMGLCVVWLHHSNKPGPDGYSTEAGSSHALTNISTQIFVKPVYRDEAQAQRKHAIWDQDERFTTPIEGMARTPFEAVAYENRFHENLLDRVTQVSYGKVREASPITERSYYLGQTAERVDWRPQLFSTKSVKREAWEMAYSSVAATKADVLGWISQRLRVPRALLLEWGLRDVAPDKRLWQAQTDA